MNILIISHFFPPHKGGLETASFYTAKKLSEFGHKVVILTSKCNDEIRDFHMMSDILVYRFKSYNLPEFKKLPQSSSFGIMLMAFFKLPYIVKLHNIQIIHAEGHVFPVTLFSYLLNQFIFKRPMFISVQGRLQFGYMGIIEHIFDKIITKHIYHKSDKIICASKSLKERLLKYKINEKKMIVIPNGVDTHTFTRKEKGTFFDQFLKGKEDYKKILFVGRLDKQKGIEYLIKAIPYVINNYKKTHFFILGSERQGNIEFYLRSLVEKLNIQPYLTFIDPLTIKHKNSRIFQIEKHFQEISKIYSSADIFCLPSLHEGFPLSIAEALSIGLIIVASKAEGIPEAVKENINGFLAEPGNVPQLIEKILKALNLSEEETNNISKNNIILAKKKYSWDVIVKSIEIEYIKSFKKVSIKCV